MRELTTATWSKKSKLLNNITAIRMLWTLVLENDADPVRRRDRLKRIKCNLYVEITESNKIC